MPKHDYIGIRARILSPFYYHGLYTRDGSATAPDVITDTALLFALRQAFFTVPPMQTKLFGKALAEQYKADLQALPWRASLLMGEGNSMLPPVHHIIDVSREGGFRQDLRKDMSSGNFTNRFYVHEVAAGAEYRGILIGSNPFPDEKKLIVRVGVGRLGMLELTQDDGIKTVRLNTATARLFGRSEIREEYRVLDTIRVSVPFSLQDAGRELAAWR